MNKLKYWIILVLVILAMIFIWHPKKKIAIQCDRNIYNCSDFKDINEAKSVFTQCYVNGDIHQLDLDNDFVPCELLIK